MQHLTELVNTIIDNLLAVGLRLLDLPVFLLLIVAGLVAITLPFFFKRRRRRRNLLAAECALVVIAAIFCLDRKISRLQDQLNELRIGMNTAASVRPDPAPVSAGPKLLFDLNQARTALAQQFDDITLHARVYDDAVDLVEAHSDAPLVQAFAMVIDLTHPGLTIQIGGSLETKTLTSAFARQNRCTLAINGEAGLSPSPDSGLGWFRGNLIERGNVQLREFPFATTPFLYFDRQNHPGFVSTYSPKRTLTPQMFNVIWGRLDAIVDGQVQTADERLSQPRTAMGINQAGTLLYLLVVDGRQPHYSMGFTRAQVGFFLKALGAYNGMLCDEGGSSCLFAFNRIYNIPSDNQGDERPTYTHFGISEQ
jgi:Phosphodiester glycosidase